jgi:glyoxylase-like metal-dependent hydrolase (beta-lactamase superfamily II)
MEIKKISSNIYAILDMNYPLGKVNAGIIESDNHLILIDSGPNTKIAKKIYEFIKNNINKPIKYLILLESHSDHIFGMSLFKEKKAKIITDSNFKHIKNYPSFMINKTKNFEFYKNTKLSKSDIKIKENQTLNIDNLKLNIIKTPGHLKDGLSVYVEKDKILFCADLIYSERDPVTRFSKKEDWQIWINSLKKISSLDINKIVCGHGKIINNPKKVINETIIFLNKLIKE